MYASVGNDFLSLFACGKVLGFSMNVYSKFPTKGAFDNYSTRNGEKQFSVLQDDYRYLNIHLLVY